MSTDAVASVAKALVPIFRDGSSFARSTAVELLSRLYSKHSKLTLHHSLRLWLFTNSRLVGVDAPGLIAFAVPEIVALALDDKDGVGAVRATAISLLVSILAATIQNTYIAEPILKQITPQAIKFIALLRNESLRTPSVRLLSLLSTDTRGHWWLLQIPM